MKKIIFTILAVLSFSFSFSQDNFKWEQTGVSTKTKDQIYSDTKMFIAQNWKSAKDVIQNDDKESGVIILKGLSVQSMHYQANDHRWTYSYTINFLMKEGKYKIIIGEISCISAYCGFSSWPLIQPCDNCEYPGFFTISLNKERYYELQASLKKEMQSIVDGYEKQISTTSLTNDGWK